MAYLRFWFENCQELSAFQDWDEQYCERIKQIIFDRNKTPVLITASYLASVRGL